MKKLIFIMLALLGMAQAVSQEYEYVPFVREGVKWVYYWFDYRDYPGYPIPDGTVLYTLELKGDTIINGKTYKAMHCYSGDAINEENDTVPAYLREEDKVVYGIFSDLGSGKEYTIYDFNDPATFLRNNAPNYALMEEDENPYKFVDTITVNGHRVKRHAFHLMGEGDFCFIEGIGYDGLYNGYTLFYLYPRFDDSPFSCLSHVIEDGKVIYRSEREKEYGNSSYLPIVRNGVTWVNERVTVNGGDTDSFYYCYTFDLVGGWHNDRCYYSSKDPSHLCADSLVSLVNDYGKELMFYDNTMLNACIDNGTDMIDLYFDNLLYTFHKSDISYHNLRNYYIEYQKGDWLNRENFIEVEPLMIEGVTCSRYAYINEQGDTAAYVVEGIGFDSYNMGDLLTPFTKEPDPDADYQEYCGLCHVIKDGKIIYKGMRYSPDNMTGIDETVADQRPRQYDDNYYNLMGQPVGKALPTTPGIYIHHGNKFVVNY